MDLPRLIAVLPCYALDDMAKNLDEQACQEFHASWTALWHPVLLARATGLPEWKRADQGSLDLENSLVICPESSHDGVDTPIIERLESQGCQWVLGCPSRSATIERIDSLWDGALSKAPAQLLPDPNDGTPEANLDLTGTPKSPNSLDDFYALGFAYLMLQGLTRKVHYGSNIDVVVLGDQAKSAAAAYLADDPVACERWLQACFDMLSQERDRYFSQSANLLDLTLLASSTLGPPLVQQLQSPHPQNLLADAELLRKLRSLNGEAWELLVEKQGTQRAEVIGGLANERSNRWFPLGTLQRDLVRGASAYRELGISPPRVYSQFEGGMSIEMPTHLRSAGYIGVLLHAFSSGSYPVTSQAKIAWEGSDTTSIDAISSAVLDAASCRSILNAINELAKQFDHHQVPTLTCVHWPARTSAAFDDLLRASRRTNAFGEWKLFDDYFSTTGYVYSNQTFLPSQFKLPLPASYGEYSQKSLALQGHLRRLTKLEATRSIASILGRVVRSIPNRDSERAAIQELSTRVEQLLYRADDLIEPNRADSPSQAEEIEASMAACRVELAEKLASILPRSPVSAADPQRWLLINPYSGPRRYLLKEQPGTYVKREDNRIYEAISRGQVSDVIVDAPPMGVVQLTAGGHDAISGVGRSHGPNLASPNGLLANEFVECQVDPKSGYLRSIMIARKRGGKLSGMPSIALVDPKNPKKPLYAAIENGRWNIRVNTPLRSEIVSTGDFVHEGKRIGKFELTFGLWRGSRSLDLRLRIDMENVSLDRHRGLWDQVPVWRTAWPSQAASISAWLQGTKTKMASSSFYAPELIEIDDAEHRIYLACPGLSLHRRVDMSFLDTLLPTSEEGICDHRFQIAVDWPRPYQSYLEFLDEPWMIADSRGPLRSGSSLWFAQASVPHVRLESLACNERQRWLLHETMGKEGRVRLSFFQDATSAARVDQQGNGIEDLPIDKGQVLIDLKPNEISYLDIG